MFFPTFHNRWAVLGVEAITMVFWYESSSYIAGVGVVRGNQSANLECIGSQDLLPWLRIFHLLCGASGTSNVQSRLQGQQQLLGRLNGTSKHIAC